ncbi:hypothetical protein CK203_061268 [Vitis vinifera]|uniref:RNase H type-1 domain-containing protein n=1 Tax=Vitis vinifera TaxID=29760 RepID=A0A438G5D0_VITVI|nr:hypothetical protein CK203_061268 [Vitis vinifera]
MVDLRVDGASRSSGSEWALLQSPTGHLEQAIRLGFLPPNNEAEYEAILSGLDLALALSVSKLRSIAITTRRPYLRCLGHSEAQYVLAELHEGYGNHSGGRSLAHRAIRKDTIGQQ